MIDALQRLKLWNASGLDTYVCMYNTGNNEIYERDRFNEICRTTRRNNEDNEDTKGMKCKYNILQYMYNKGEKSLCDNYWGITLITNTIR